MAQETKSFDGNWLLEQNAATQRFYLQTAIDMAGSIAGEAHPKIHSCMANWFPRDKAVREERFEEVLGFMRQHPNHSPTAIVIATIQKHCGDFKQS